MSDIHTGRPHTFVMYCMFYLPVMHKLLCCQFPKSWFKFLYYVSQYNKCFQWPPAWNWGGCQYISHTGRRSRIFVMVAMSRKAEAVVPAGLNSKVEQTIGLQLEPRNTSRALPSKLNVAASTRTSLAKHRPVRAEAQLNAPLCRTLYHSVINTRVHTSASSAHWLILRSASDRVCLFCLLLYNLSPPSRKQRFLPCRVSQADSSSII